MNQQSFERQTAFWVELSKLTEGTTIKEDTATQYKTKDGYLFSRVNVCGVVLAKETNELWEGITIEDGTGKINVRSFEKRGLFEGIEIENIVNVIGKVREYNDVSFISAEIVKKTTPEFISFRKKQLPNMSKYYKKEEKKEIKTETTVIGGETEKIISLLREMDKGNGADIEEVIQKSGMSNAESVIEDLIQNGDIFEIQPGKIKVLD